MFVPLKTQPETVKFVYFPLAQQLLDLQLFNSSLQGFLCPKKSFFFAKTSGDRSTVAPKSNFSLQGQRAPTEAYWKEKGSSPRNFFGELRWDF